MLIPSIPKPGGPGGGGDDARFQITNPAKNQTVLFDGTHFVNAAPGTSFLFSIASFSSNAGASTQEIGDGVWKAAGAISFSAGYTNGPATGGSVNVTGAGNAWSSALALANTFQGPTVSSEAVNHRTSVGNITFQLSAACGAESDTETISVSFYNRVHWGVSESGSGWDSFALGNLANSQITNVKNGTYTITAGANDYLLLAYPVRLGTSVFRINGLSGGFEAPVQVMRQNASGFEEYFYVYRSTLTNLGACLISVDAFASQIYNSVRHGKTTVVSGFSEGDILALANSQITNDHTQTWPSITMNAGEYWAMAWPTRLGIPAFYDNSTGFMLDVTSPETVAVTNEIGATENYYILRSTYANLGTLTVRTQ